MFRNSKYFLNNWNNVSDKCIETYPVSKVGALLGDILWLSVLTTLASKEVYLGVVRKLCSSNECAK